jgi:hypothetical protein
MVLEGEINNDVAGGLDPGMDVGCGLNNNRNLV